MDNGAELPETDLADDLLTGAGKIASFMGPEWTARRVYHYADRGAIPVIRRPGLATLFARKSELRRAFGGAA